MAGELGFTTHRSLVLDFGVGKGQDTIGALTRDLLGIPPGSHKAHRAACAEAAFTDGRLAEEWRVFLNDLLDLPQGDRLQGLFDAMDHEPREEGKGETLAALLRSAAETAPLLVVIEDIHWADQTTLRCLAQLAETVADCAALLVMTSRIEADPRVGDWLSGLRKSPLTTIELKPLRPEETLRLAGELGQAERGQIERFAARSEGNPLFLEQLMRNASESAEEHLPESLQGLVLARMDRLPRRDRDALQAAAVIGQRFALPALRQLLADPRYDCGTLIAHRLVRPDGEAFLFDHALIRDGVYGSLLRDRRRDLHGRAAAWFESTDPALYAEHLDLAEDPRATEAYVAAARQEAAHHRTGRALEFARRGLELAKAAKSIFELHSLKGEVLADLERFEESFSTYDAAAAVACSSADRCWALLGQAQALLRLDRYPEAEVILDAAEALAAEQDLTEVAAQIHRHRATITFARGDVRATFAESARVLQLAEHSGLQLLRAGALSCMGDAEAASGKFLSARGYYQDCLDICEREGFRQFAVIHVKMLGDNDFYRGKLRAARAAYERVIREAAELRNRRGEAFARHMIAYFHCFEGKAEAALEEVAVARELLLRIYAKRFLMNNLCLKGVAYRLLDERDRALRTLQEAESWQRFSAWSRAMPWVLGERALTLEDPAARARVLDRGEAMLAAGEGGYFNFEFYRPAMEAALESRDWPRARRLALAFEKSMGSEVIGLPDFFIRRARALADAGEGGGDPAILSTLRDQALEMGLPMDARALEQALAGVKT